MINLNLLKVKVSVLSKVKTRKYDLAQLCCIHVLKMNVLSEVMTRKCDLAQLCCIHILKMSVLPEVMTRKYDLAQLFCFHVCLVWPVLGDDLHNLEIRFNASL